MIDDTDVFELYSRLSIGGWHGALACEVFDCCFDDEDGEVDGEMDDRSKEDFAGSFFSAGGCKLDTEVDEC